MIEDTISSGSLYYIDSTTNGLNVIFISIAILNHDEDDIMCLKLNLRNCDTITVYRTKYTLQHHYKQLI